MSFHDVVTAAPPAKDGDGPAVQRLQTADGVNIIAMRFRAGQALPDHRAAHPILVQCMEGQVRFSVGDRTEVLTPGRVAHLPAMVPHRVDADEDSVFLLSMLT
ncbi:cupin domain-containing protein [Corynebacterium xerosis]|uniref:Cupin domain-containing protein n=1 Tax=Corynebacterium xerosis TaxID=1725 RepID=A0A7X9SV70_9CORY|nr:cupin domain-containing protein [Corynebacterium xerosis]